MQTRQKLWITNNLPAASVFTHIRQTPIGIDNQGGHGDNWRRLVDGDVLLLQIHPVCVLSAHKPKAMGKQNKVAAAGAAILYEGCDGLEPSKRVSDQQVKDRSYWIDEIAFLEARLNGCLLYTSDAADE